MSAAASSASARPRRRGEITAERILDEAEALFAERGYAGTTLRDVAGRVGIRIPSLYNHFPSKDSLYGAVLERVFGPAFEVFAEYGAAAPGSPAREGAHVLRRLMAILGERPTLARLVQQEVLAGGERLTPVLRERMLPAFARGGEMLEETARGTRWRPEQVPHLLLALYHAVFGYFATAPLWRGLNGEDLLAPEALARQTRFLIDLTATLFPEESPPEG